MDAGLGINKLESRISVIHGDILDIKADYLVSSGNPWLNMSGGVNGSLLERYGSMLILTKLFI